MKKFNIIKWIFLPWTIIQNLVGFGCFVYAKCKGKCKRIKTDENFIYYEVDSFSPVSLGLFVFLNINDRYDIITQRHEWGHQIQSLILGPLYLFLIGLPSACSHIFNTYHNDNITYYNYPWEKWADSLGKIKHKDLHYTREL